MSASTRSLGAIYRQSIHPQKVAPPLTPAPDLKHELTVLDGGKVLLEKDVGVRMRDGVTLYVDVYRPVVELHAKSPSIVLFAPFGKHGAVPREKFANMGVDFGKLSKYTLWELPDPLLWCGEWGYSFVSVDPRGTWWSEGEQAEFLSPQEGRDGYDIVEWIAQQKWSTGNIGWGAVSYFAMSSYQTAVLKPPHLKAIMPWEGISDLYREVNTIGGIPNVAFQQLWMNMTGNGIRESEDHAVASIEHPLFDSWWASKVVDWSLIDIPAFSITGWSSLGLHLRGTIEAWKAFSSKQKYLFIHGGREWSEYYKEHNVLKQKHFWDRFLKDSKNEVGNWAPIEIDVRSTADQSSRRKLDAWPPGESTTAYYFLPDGQLSPEQPSSTNKAQYVSFQAHRTGSTITFQCTFKERTEVIGHSALKTYIQALAYPDVDLYVALQKLNKDGEQVLFYHSTQQIEASATFGWLRASHRELDETRTRSDRPYHTHARRQWLRPSDVVEVQIELWPSSTIWEAGETLRIAIQGHSFTNPENPTQFKGPSHGFGEVRLWFGGSYDSKVILPVV